MAEKLIKVVYNYHDQQNYQYFLSQPDGVDAPNCTDITEINREWVRAVDGDEAWEITNINQKFFKK